MTSKDSGLRGAAFMQAIADRRLRYSGRTVTPDLVSETCQGGYIGESDGSKGGGSHGSLLIVKVAGV